MLASSLKQEAGLEPNKPSMGWACTTQSFSQQRPSTKTKPKARAKTKSTSKAASKQQQQQQQRKDARSYGPLLMKEEGNEHADEAVFRAAARKRAKRQSSTVPKAAATATAAAQQHKQEEEQVLFVGTSSARGKTQGQAIARSSDVIVIDDDDDFASSKARSRSKVATRPASGQPTLKVCRCVCVSCHGRFTFFFLCQVDTTPPPSGE